MNLYLLCSIVWAIIVVISVINLFKRTDLTDTAKRVWVVIIVLAPVIGLLVYYFKATPRKII